jgi:hypothetical protein
MGLTRLPFLSLPPRHPYQTFDLWIRTHSQKDPSQTRGEHYKISKADFMANFTKRNYENDVAVLTLDRPVNFGPSVWPVCLPMLTAPTASSSGAKKAAAGSRGTSSSSGLRGSAAVGQQQAVDAPGTTAVVLGWGYDKER